MSAKAAVRAEVLAWGLGQATDDPGETLLRLLTQSRWRAEFLSGLLAQAYEAAERLGEADGGHVVASEDAGRDLEVVLQLGGVSALVGKTYSAAGKDGFIFASGEGIRALAVLESQERDRCARFAKLALDAGIAERQVRIAEKQVAMVADALRAAMVEAGFGERVNEVLAGVGRRLRLAAS